MIPIRSSDSIVSGRRGTRPDRLFPISFLSSLWIEPLSSRPSGPFIQYYNIVFEGNFSLKNHETTMSWFRIQIQSLIILIIFRDFLSLPSNTIHGTILAPNVQKNHHSLLFIISWKWRQALTWEEILTLSSSCILQLNFHHQDIAN